MIRQIGGKRGNLNYNEFVEVVKEGLQRRLGSSYETIIIKATKDKEVSTLQDMVQNINNTVVSDEDVLSDKVYCYYRNSKKLEIA